MTMDESFLNSISKAQWQKIGTQKRSGVAVPLFSIYTKDSLGCGEIPDLIFLIDWCRKVNLSVIQLLPLNDMGYSFFPYDSQSAFALDPIYISLNKIKDIDVGKYHNDIFALKQPFSLGGERAKYEAKGAKLKLLWEIFQEHKDNLPEKCQSYIEDNAHWLNAYATYRVLKEQHRETSWEQWPEQHKNYSLELIDKIKEEFSLSFLFQQWVQWQLFEQFVEVKKYAQANKVSLMGDIPLLVSRDSAGVWSQRDYFKLDFAAGSPPDRYYADGQRWGMPPYNWSNIEKDSFMYIRNKLKYAENFYDLYRIDHAIGLFRIWAIPTSEPEETLGKNGSFDPVCDVEWEKQGRRLIAGFLNSTTMLPCAEDLGLVPECSYRMLKEYGIPGMDIQRWLKDWGDSYDFKGAEDYRENAIASLSTHDTSSLKGWWDYECETVDEIIFYNTCKRVGLDFELAKSSLFDLSKTHKKKFYWKTEINSVDDLLKVTEKEKGEVGELIDLFLSSKNERKKFLSFLGFESEDSSCAVSDIILKSIESINKTNSIFCILSLFDWLMLDLNLLPKDSWEYRVNFPGEKMDKNWSLLAPISLEELLNSPINDLIKGIISSSRRAL